MDKVKETLLAALKQAAIEQGEQRLYRSGKFDGLFSSRNGLHGQASQYAVEHQLLEVVRTETKGKNAIEWVRLTDKGQEFVRQGESPARAMDELSEKLRTTHDGLPVWLEEIQLQFAQLAQQISAEVQRIGRRLAVLSERVENAIRATQTDQPTHRCPQDLPWASDALDYLNNRHESSCPLSELFAILRRNHPDLSIRQFHSGIRRLYDRGLIKLSPITNGELPHPEYALLVDSTLYYFVDR